MCNLKIIFRFALSKKRQMKTQRHTHRKKNQRCWGSYEFEKMRKEMVHTLTPINSPKSSLYFYGERLYDNKREKYIWV